MSIYSNVGEVLKEYRTDCKLTQEYVAQKIGVSARAYGDYERNKSIIDIFTLNKFINLIKVTAVKDKMGVSEISLLTFLKAYNDKNYLSEVDEDKTRAIEKTLDNLLKIEDKFDLSLLGDILNDKQIVFRHLLTNNSLPAYIENLTNLLIKADVLREQIYNINSIIDNNSKNKTLKEKYGDEIIKELQEIKNNAYTLNNTFINKLIDDYFKVKK